MTGQYSVNGHHLFASQLSVRVMNFGQHWRTSGITEALYEVALPLWFFAAFLKRQLPGYYEDCRRHPGDGEPEDSLRQSGWLAIPVILAGPKLSAALLIYFGHELLLEWFGDDGPKALPGFVLNTVDSAELRGDRVILRGRAREAGEPVSYQDV
jgi:hypothetical protein